MSNFPVKDIRMVYLININCDNMTSMIIWAIITITVLSFMPSTHGVNFSFTIATLCQQSRFVFQSHACGVSVAERMGWKNGPHEAGLLGAWFNSVSYDSRTYVSGLSLPLSYRTVSLYGKGVYVSAKYFLKAGQRISVGAVSTHMVYFDRSHISSGTNKIDSRSKNDLYLQLNVFL